MSNQLPNLHRICAMRQPTLRRPPPAAWAEEPFGDPNQCPTGRMFQRGAVRVLVTDDQMDDGSWWLHVSASTRHRVPTYDELCRVKNDFIGRQHEAIMLFAKESEHVNAMPHCLHLWSLQANERA